MNRKLITTKQQIAKYWKENNTIHETNLNFNWVDAEKCCWNCGNETKHLNRCHIIPHMLGGMDKPNNYVLLCGSCDNIAPNIGNSKAMWDWIISNKQPIKIKNTYQIQKAFDEFKLKHGYSFFDKAIYIKDINLKLVEYVKNIGVSSFGITISTYVYLFESILENEKLYTTPQILFYETLLTGLVDLKKNNMSNKIIAGLNNAKLNGKFGGRPKISQDVIVKIIEMKNNGLSLRKIGKTLGIHHATVGVYVKQTGR